MRVEQFYNKNQFSLTDNTTGKRVFQSYDSTIAIYESNTLTLGSDWDYSKTTMKHLYLWLSENALSVKGIQEALDSKNKREAIQKLIDAGIIKYNNSL